MKWITTGLLKVWLLTKKKDCEQTLPELVRRLIFATAPTITSIDFPSGDSVAIGGWDGHLETPVVSPMFPSGISAWELGTGSSETKAESDYKKRTKNPLGFVQKDTTFVFATLKPWPGAKNWANSKKKGPWKDVKVITASNLEQWLDIAPAVGLWLARKINGLSEGIRDIEGFWDEWAAYTRPYMTTQIVIAGRERDLERVHLWLQQDPTILEVRGDSPDEPFAFLYSSIMALPELERIKALSRCIIVENIQQFRSCVSSFTSPLIIVAPADCRDAAGQAVGKGHHVFLSADAISIDTRDNLMHLSRPNRDAVEDGLIQNGLSKSRAQAAARDFGWSMPVLRRHFSLPSAKRPLWTEAKSASILIPLLFAGAWDENKKGDRDVIESLSALPYDEYVNLLKPLLSIDDSPILKVGPIWKLKSPLDAWFMIASHLTEKHLQLFERAVIAILTETDPKYDLKSEDRWLATIYGKDNPCSEWVRTGLVESLILIAVHGDRSENIASTQEFTNRVVKAVFSTAIKWESWASVKDVTPLLAEAAPETFMGAIEDIISNNPLLFQELLLDDGGLFGECRHAGLLWGIEGIAWKPEYFTRVSQILLELSKIDKGGRWVNRPINTLKDLFILGLPQTYASPELRLKTLDLLIKTNPVIVWQFAHSYYGGGTISESFRFKWRDPGGERRGLEYESVADHLDYEKGLLPRLMDLACRKENIVSALSEFTKLPSDLKKKLLFTLESVEVTYFSEDEQRMIVEHTRNALNWTNSYGDAEHKKYVPELNDIYNKFRSSDILERNAWLLSTPWPRIPEGEPKDYSERVLLIKTLRTKAMREILDHVSLNKILEFAGSIEYVGVLGYALGKVIKNQEEDFKILDAMVNHLKDNTFMIGVLQSYSLGRVEEVGPNWIDDQIKRMKIKGNYSVEACSQLYFGRKEGADTWSDVAGNGKEFEDAYWKSASGNSQSDKSDASIAVEKLLQVNRPSMALQVAGNQDISLPTDLLRRLLKKIVEMDPKDVHDSSMYIFYLGQVFKQVYDNDDLSLEEMAQLEWPFAVLFEQMRQYTRKPMALHRALQKDPSFFALLVSLIYKRDKGAPLEEIKDKDPEGRARVARAILDTWQLLPGINSDGSVDEGELEKWIIDARKACAKAYHITTGDLQIASLLARAPSAVDGIWPHIAIRNIIERLNNEVIDRHIEIEIRNKRGITTRGPNEGGQQERVLAEKYREMSRKTLEWPRTSVILRSIAESYDHDAKRNDIHADLNDLM